jgi:hypothetical protein
MMQTQNRSLELAVRIVPEPWRALRDGCDVEAWLREHLVDTVIASDYCTMPGTVRETLDIRPLRKMTAGKARLLANVWRYGDFSSAVSLARQAYAQGADGVTFYESDYLVFNPERRRRLRDFRHPSLSPIFAVSSDR